MSEARNDILNTLRQQRVTAVDAPEPYRPQHNWDLQQRIERFSEAMCAVRGEVVRLPDGDWIDWLNKELPTRGYSRILVGECDRGRAFIDRAAEGLEVRAYDQPVEQWKPSLFSDIEVGISTTLGAIAQTGSLILWPDSAEPRLLSLAPPVHIALVEASTIYNTFADAMHEQNWAGQMPTNALLVSGPSKTADIEQTLAYGIHGPRQLIVLILG